MTHINKIIYIVARKLSGKTDKQFSLMFTISWFFNRSVLRSAWHAMTQAMPQGVKDKDGLPCSK